MRPTHRFVAEALIALLYDWIASVSGKGWFAILRFSGPLEAWFQKTWRRGDRTGALTGAHEKDRLSRRYCSLHVPGIGAEV